MKFYTTESIDNRARRIFLEPCPLHKHVTGDASQGMAKDKFVYRKCPKSFAPMELIAPEKTGPWKFPLAVAAFHVLIPLYCCAVIVNLHHVPQGQVCDAPITTICIATKKSSTA